MSLDTQERLSFHYNIYVIRTPLSNLYLKDVSQNIFCCCVHVVPSYSRYSFCYYYIANMHNQRKKSDTSCWSLTAQFKKMYILLLPSNLDPELKLSFSLISLRHFPYCSNANVDHELPFVSSCWSLIRTCITLSNVSSYFLGLYYHLSLKLVYFKIF